MFNTLDPRTLSELYKAAEAVVDRTNVNRILVGAASRGYGSYADAILSVFDRSAGSPFDELLVTKFSEAKNWLTRAQVSDDGARSAIVERLLDLVETMAESDECDLPTKQSLDSAVDFFSRRPDLVEPMLSVTPNGNVWAEWKDRKNGRAAIEFLGNGSVNLVALYPDARQPWRKESIAANLSRNAASDQIRRTSSLSWLIG